MQIDWTTEKQMIGVTFLIYILGIKVIMREKKDCRSVINDIGTSVCFIDIWTSINNDCIFFLKY